MHQQHVRHRHRPSPLSNVFFFVAVVVLLFQEHYYPHPYRRSIVVTAQKMTILLFFVKILYCYHQSLCGELLITSLVQIMIPRQQICVPFTPLLAGSARRRSAATAAAVVVIIIVAIESCWPDDRPLMSAGPRDEMLALHPTAVRPAQV